MKKLSLQRLFFLIVLIIGLCGFVTPFSWLFSFSNPNKEPLGSHQWIKRQTQIIKSQVANIDDKVLRLSLLAYMNARKKGYVGKELLTVIDYSKPSTSKRLWVFDMKRGRTLFNTWVSHGKNSGGVYPTSFSNSDGSLKSSIGVFMTDSPYFGKNGYSLRLRGMEPGINDHAYERAIVIHGANYVNPDIIRRYGKIGRSWGCPAVSTNMSRSLINTIREKSVVFAYYPDRKWLSRSRFLAG